MARSRKLLTVGALGAAAVALVASTTVTGAYFSDAAPGTISGTVGTVKLTTTDTTFAWENMLPGEPKTATVGFTNAGTGPQDFYLVFPNGPALHALNNLGSYGEVHVTGGPTGTIGSLFDSANLQDGRTRESGISSCGDFDPSGCWPLPAKIKLASGVAVQGTGSLTFTFNYAGKLGTSSTPRASGGGVFNTYPLASQAYGADAAGPAGAGLPFEVVAVQVGQQP
jgi:hypothetical protein